MESFNPDLVFLWRAIERLAGVLIGALVIYLGYKLFVNLPERREERKGELKLMLPGDISVYVSRVGPGVFFALFGSAVVLMSFASPAQLNAPGDTVRPPSAQEPAPPVPMPGSFSYVVDPVEADRFSADRAAVKRDLETLRSLEAVLSNYVGTLEEPRIGVNEASTLLSTLRRVKRSLLLSVWDDAWGDSEAFCQWVRQGALYPPPAGLDTVAAMFTAPPRPGTP